jgi:hypothetical protein
MLHCSLLARNLLGLGSGSQATVTFFRDGQLDTLLLGEGDHRLVALANDENVGQARGELTVQGILDVDNVKAAQVTFTVRNDTNATHIATARDKANVALYSVRLHLHNDDTYRVKLDKVDNLASLQVELDGVVDLDQRIRVADGTTVVRNQERNTLGAQLDLLDLAKLVLRGAKLSFANKRANLGFFGGDAVDREATLDVINQAKVFARLFNGNDV